MRRALRTLLFVTCALLINSAALGAEEEEGAAAGAAYHALEPSIIANLTGGPRYIRCDIQLKTDDAMNLPDIELHNAAIRHAILLLAAGQDGKQLQTREGKEALRKNALAAVQTTLKELTGKPMITDLYFTAYYVQ